MSARDLKPAKCALLVIDMQNRFSGIAHRLAKRLSGLVDDMLTQGMPVFLTQHHDDDDQTTELIKFWGDDVRIKMGSKDWCLMDEFKDKEAKGGKMIKEKTT
jgi:nicotinamidase-related amidase